MPALSIRGLSKAFGTQAVLHDINLEVETGEFLVLLGPSGCGKSTLLSAIAGLDPVTRGRIVIGARDVTDLEPKDRNIAMVFQSYALYPSMTVRENIGFALKMRGLPRAAVAAAVDQAAQILQLELLLDRKPSQLSGGQRQRVAIGRALVRQPDLFLFDEPLSNLDAKLRDAMRGELKMLHRRLAATIVYVTHDQIEAMTLASRIVVMRAGRIEQVGTPDALYNRPANLFVAGFLGTPGMNIIPGRLATRGSGVTFQRPGLDLPLADYRPAAPLAPDREVLLGIRPEAILDGSRPSDTAIQVSLPLTWLEATGADTYARLDAGGQEIVARLPGHVRPDGDQPLAVWLDLSAVSLFDPESGVRL
ncbi:MAG: sn-glycerol-3-phosphate ABC transporter ATP-binding protein UgpC [Azospirillaceae bacterium]|nr:sn-glycerol-3-phosphate ABC transporter ATP-binding protein UgpC [Azospirillaceae bacterium]